MLTARTGEDRELDGDCRREMVGVADIAGERVCDVQSPSAPQLKWRSDAGNCTFGEEPAMKVDGEEEVGLARREEGREEVGEVAKGETGRERERGAGGREESAFRQNMACRMLTKSIN